MSTESNEKSILVLTKDTRLNRALDLHPQVVDYIVSLNPHEFDRLYNPLMRHLMAPRITIGRIAAMVHKPVDELLDHIAGLSGATVEYGQPDVLPKSSIEPPSWVSNADPTAVRIIDLLPLDEALNADPMPPVMVGIKALAPGDVLLIKHKWEPQPFYDAWSKMGNLEWFSEQISDSEWWIWVYRILR